MTQKTSQTTNKIHIKDEKVFSLEITKEFIKSVKNDPEWARRLTETSSVSEIVQMIGQKMTKHILPKVVEALPQIWTEYLSLLDQKYQDDCQDVLVENNDASQAWFLLDQETRDHLASLLVMEELIKLSKLSISG